MAKLDLSKSPTQLIHELIKYNNPDASKYELLVDNVKADGGLTSAHVSDVSGSLVGYSNIKYTRIDLSYLFSLIEHEFSISDDVDKTTAVISEVLRKYNVALNVNDFTITHYEDSSTITANADNPSYIGSVTFSTIIPLTTRVSEIVLNGFQIENNLRELITVDALPLYLEPTDYVEGKLYATPVTMGWNYSALQNNLAINLDGTLKEYDIVHDYFTKNHLPEFPKDLVFTKTNINVEFEGELLYTMLTSKPYVGDDWAGTVVIRF